MPSHGAHMTVGRLVCGYYNSEIDETIDRHPAHDEARVNCGTLFSQAKAVLGEHGEKGLCYYVLHHYLDKVENIVFGQILSQWSRKHLDEDDGFEKAFKDVVGNLGDFLRAGLESEVSTLRVVEIMVLEGFKDYRDFWDFIEYGFALADRYTSRTRSRKVRGLSRLWMDCLPVVEREADLAVILASTSRHVRERIAENAEKIWCTILRHDFGRLALGARFGRDRLLYMMETLQCDKP
jgi:hypothetical protein